MRLPVNFFKGILDFYRFFVVHVMTYFTYQPLISMITNIKTAITRNIKLLFLFIHRFQQMFSLLLHLPQQKLRFFFFVKSV